jgi:hypothetical protein
MLAHYSLQRLCLARYSRSSAGEFSSLQLVHINVCQTDRILNDEDRRYLRYILSHWFGWSATAVEHMQDPAFCYLRYRFAVVGKLEPILDNMTYVEEAFWMLRAVGLDSPTALLLASSDRFYVYMVELDTLFNAGASLKEVSEGLRKARNFTTMTGSGWEEVEANKENLDSFSYFPEYDIFDRTLIHDISAFVKPSFDYSLGKCNNPDCELCVTNEIDESDSIDAEN